MEHRVVPPVSLTSVFAQVSLLPTCPPPPSPEKGDEQEPENHVIQSFSRDESLSGSDITSKLEPAFLSGLRCTQPLIRAKFFEVFDASMKRRVYERLLYICCSQNWEAMGSHFWIKQCIEVNL